ncbi:Myotubularin-related protein 7 [Bagarius yarrelli]|uniref:Myotubularin-related protein 7 n=1 Tax=Bagarius yarrelli TaxID=175774 RepID=A0A556U8C2_BAGYA|nr:Myotubularin-related protein 7 [Bagarius yarrelli]
MASTSETKVENVRLIDWLAPRRSAVGTLYLSSTHTIFVENSDARKETWEREKAWSFLELRADFSRMGIPSNLWHVTPANYEYRICDTYPSELYVPKSASPAVIVGSAKFRSRGRLPVLSYFHRDTGAAVCRSSQPLSGFSTRSPEDEQMLQAIMKSNPASEYMYVVDTRPKLNAMANRAAGKGYENEDHYTNIRLQFIGIENIHVMRSSQQKLIEIRDLRSPSMGDFLWGLENSGWLKHIKAVLDAGVFIAKVLIEKDWVSFGHKFSHRYAHLDGDPKEVSPVIDQFLECVWQLMEQFPCAFEFNERFLLQLHTHVHSCQERTHSLWPCVWEKRSEFINPLYRSDHSQTQGVLRPQTTPYCFKFWKSMYSSAERGRASHQSPSAWLSAVKEESQQLEEELNTHQERLTQLLQSKTRKLKNGATECSFRPLLKEKEVSSNHVDYFTCTTPTAGRENHAPPFILPLKSPTNPKATNADDLSVSSDLESGVADLGSQASSSCDDTKDRHLDEVAYMST